jgi:hypothetical protein
MKVSKTGLAVPSIDTVRARNPAVAVSIQGTHIVYHRTKRELLNSTSTLSQRF